MPGEVFINCSLDYLLHALADLFCMFAQDFALLIAQAQCRFQFDTTRAALGSVQSWTRGKPVSKTEVDCQPSYVSYVATLPRRS